MSDFSTPRITEKRYFSISPRNLTANGTIDGVVTLESVEFFKVGMLVMLKSDAVQNRQVKIKRFISSTQFVVCDAGKSVTTSDKLDISDFLVSDSSTVEFQEDKRPVIDILEIQRQVYEEEPTVALRTHSVDWLGRSYDQTNPVPVQLSDGSINIGTVNAELEVQLSHEDVEGKTADSVKVGDGTEIIEVNPDGSINVNLVQSQSSNEEVKNVFASINNVVAAAETTIVAYTVPVNRVAYLQRVEFSGANIGRYRLYVDSVSIASKRTHHGSGLSGEINFIGGSKEGLFLSSNTLVQLRIQHSRNPINEFDGRVQILEKII
jgi:hypothetical protein